MNVGQLMTSDIWTCNRDDSLESAARVMWERDCGVVPVVDADRRLVGIVTDRDICMATFSKGMAPAEIAISSIALKKVMTVRPDDPVQLAEDCMKTQQLRRLVVVDAENRPVGIVSLNDLARRAGARGNGLTTDEVARTLSAICQPPASLGRPTA